MNYQLYADHTVSGLASKRNQADDKYVQKEKYRGGGLHAAKVGTIADGRRRGVKSFMCGGGDRAVVRPATVSTVASSSPVTLVVQITVHCNGIKQCHLD